MARIFVTRCFYRVSVTINVRTGPNNRSSVKDWDFTHREQVKWIARILQQGSFSFFLHISCDILSSLSKMSPTASFTKVAPSLKYTKQQMVRRSLKTRKKCRRSTWLGLWLAKKKLGASQWTREPGWDVQHEETLNAFGKCLFSVTWDYGYVSWILLWPVEIVESLFQQP